MLDHLRKTHQGIRFSQAKTLTLENHKKIIEDSIFFLRSSNSTLIDNVGFKVIELNGKFILSKPVSFLSHPEKSRNIF